MSDTFGDKIDMCPQCGYPTRQEWPPENRVKLKPREELDPETIAVLECAKRAKAEVATWPAWKANECRCPS